MAKEKLNTAVKPEVRITRILKAPRELVWKMWTDSKLLASWWGPKGFTSPVCNWDAKAGSKFFILMKAPDGTDYPMEGEFMENIHSEKLVFISVPLNSEGKKMFTILTHIQLTDEGNDTKLSVAAEMQSTQPDDPNYVNGMNVGWNQSLDRLQESTAKQIYLAHHKDSINQEIIAIRMLNAPRELVWEAWTDPKHIVKWWGPNGFTNTNKKMDVTPNGTWTFTMHGPDGKNYPNKIHFLEVIKPEKLVYRHAGDEDTEPVTFNVTVTFEKHDKKTLVTMIATFPSAAELDRINKQYGAIEGFHQNISKLDDYMTTTLTNTEPFVIERIYNAPVAKVWKAITNKEEMKEWYFDLADFKAEPGFEFQFTGGTKDKKYLHLCKVTEAVTGKKLAYTWRYEDYPGSSTVTFELIPEGDQTRLRLTHEGLASFPQDDYNTTKPSFATGWTFIIGTSLMNYLSK